MSNAGPGETTAQPRGEFGLLHAAALTAVVTGAVGSLGITLWVGRHNPSLFLIVLFAFWVLSPFVALVWASVASKRWPVVTRTTLHSLMLVITLSSLALYGDVVLRPPRSTPAARFLLVPLGSWLLMTIIIPIAALISGRLSRRGAGTGRQDRQS
jgi:amino acid transporter